MKSNKLRDFERLTKEEFIEEYNCSYKAYDEVVIEYTREKVNEIFEGNPNYSDNNVTFIIQDSLDKDIYALVISNDGGDGRMVNVVDNLKSYNAFDWDFSFDGNLFYYLECGYEIKYMDQETHNGIMAELEFYYPHSIQNIEGVKRYFEYCMENNINLEQIAKLENQERDFNHIEWSHNHEVVDYEEPNEIPIKSEKVYDHNLTKKELLQEVKDMIKHNISCYSEGHFISKPKKGFEKEFNMEHAKLKLIDEIIKDVNKLTISPKVQSERSR